MEYKCYHLSSKYKLAHEDDAQVLFESDDLGECAEFVFNEWIKHRKDIAVYQPRTGNYREYYRNPYE